MTAKTLPLDEKSIDPSTLSREALMRELTLQKRPFRILREFMKALEQKRAAKGLGWSRPWNKYGLTVFRTHIHPIGQDAKYLIDARELIQPCIAKLPDEYQLFVDDLWCDPNLKAFTFYHNNKDEWGEFEGLSLSLGRKVAHDPSKRDRIDLILEDKRVDGAVDGSIERVRLYVNPWLTYQNREYKLIEQGGPFEPVDEGYQDFYQESCRRYDRWKTDKSRQWSHWSANYIEYFGPRCFIPKGSSFI
ncbi:hypothetical protein [Pelagicoccus sp. SDUM812003]|uniref:hypothetical protein n=1 Tax=Pelagicoccus sp. SDUM812003 TaxID=3041267 RepID=UPI002810656B|nr:hypothetical protein [Pelagicoccus sp. SDUM812003]MDQ8204190.1 hypothetical protein [Pelagicoccus sp. SDUM812003]